MWSTSSPQIFSPGHIGTYVATIRVTEIPWIDENSEWELLSLLGDWYKPKSFDSVFSSIVSDAVHFSI